MEDTGGAVRSITNIYSLVNAVYVCNGETDLKRNGFYNFTDHNKLSFCYTKVTEKIVKKQNVTCGEEHSAAEVQQQHQVAPATREPLASHPQLLSASCYQEEEGSGGSLLLRPPHPARSGQ